MIDQRPPAATPPAPTRARRVLAALPLVGLSFALVVAAAPLGLWLLGIEGLAARAAGGRDWVLSVAGSAVVYLLAVVALVRRGGDLPMRWVWAALGVCAAAAVWGAIGVAHHGVAQTLVGLRLTLLPLAFLVAVAALDRADLRRLWAVLSWLVIANGAAAVVEALLGPHRLVDYGFELDRAIRWIGGVFRVPGLTEFNAELGMLCGAYLLAYAALWLSRADRPRGRLSHAAALAAAVGLALSTSRSGAVLVVAGVIGAVLLDRSRSGAGKRLAVLLAGGLVAVVAGAFAVLGAAGASSLLDRLRAWRDLVGGMAPFGDGIGGAGAATNSRVADTAHLAVDNYFLSVGLQFGPLAMVALVVLVGAGLVVASRRSARRPAYVVALAVLCGLAGASLFIETWEYAAAMAALALVVVQAFRPDEAAR